MILCSYRALEASLLSSGLSENEIEELRRQNQEQLEESGAIGNNSSDNDLSRIMELSKRDEEARLSRLREEEEELEKVNQFPFHIEFP